MFLKNNGNSVLLKTNKNLLVLSAIILHLGNNDVVVNNVIRIAMVTFCSSTISEILKLLRMWKVQINFKFNLLKYCPGTRQAKMFIPGYPNWLYTVRCSEKRKKKKKIPQSRICPALCVLHQCTIVFEWKCRLFCLRAHVQCLVCYIYHVDSISG